MFAAGVLAALGLLLAFALLRDLPSRIAGGEHGRLAIQNLDEVRRPFLEIEDSSSTLMMEGHDEAVAEDFRRGVARGRALIAEFQAAAAYDPEIVQRVGKLAQAFEAWVETVQTLFEIARGDGPGGGGSLHEVEALASGGFSRTMSLLGDVEGPIHEDIDRGSDAVKELTLSAAGVIASLLAAAFWLMRSRNKILATMLAELQQTDAARRESEERFHTLLREVDDVVWASAADGSGMLYVNPACEQVYGRPATDFFERPDLWIEAVHPDDRDRVQQESGALFEEGRSNLEYRIVRPNGEIRWLSDRKHLILDSAGDPIRLGGLATDITERVKAREEREAFVEELESKNAELERFAYTVSHDLKSPLVTISGFLGLIQKDIDQDNLEQVQRDLAQIKSATNKMQRLLKELLELSRIGHLARASEEVSLTEVAQEAAELVAGQLEASGVEVEIDPAMPPVFGDRVRLLEVYQNLLENAAKFTGDQAAPRVEVGVRREEEGVRFFVRDNGQGIDPRHHEKVFGLFEQLSAQTEGTGIGLALAKRIVEVHGGLMWVESKGEGHGSTFWFTLPDAGKARQSIEVAATTVP